MEEDLYKKYLKNIANGKTAIKKEYVDSGYFSYYSKREINNHLNSKKIIIDGLNCFYEDFLYDVFNRLKEQKPLDYKTIFLGKVGPKLNKLIKKSNYYEVDTENYNLAISDFDIQHIYNKHYLKKERQRGQKILQRKDVEMIPNVIANTKEVTFIGKNKRGLSLYKFVSYNEDGTFNLIEFIGNSKKQLGLKTIYTNLRKH